MNKAKKNMLIKLASANQIIMNAYNTLDKGQQIEAYEYFTRNSAEMLYILGGEKALEKVKNYIFINKEVK